MGTVQAPEGVCPTMPESLLGAGTGLLACVVALIARVRWKVPAADLQRLLEASSPSPLPTSLPLPRRANAREQDANQSEAA